MTARRVAAIGLALGVWTAPTETLRLDASAGQRAASVTVSPNRPYIAGRAKLHFFNPNSVETGAAKSLEDVAYFGGISGAENSRYVRLGVKAPKGQNLVISCAVAAKPGGPSDHFEIVGPDVSMLKPLTSKQLSWAFVPALDQWHWFTIAATAPWTFHACAIGPGK